MIHIAARSGHQQETAARMLAGMKRHGQDAEIVGDYSRVRSKVAVCWGWRIGRQLREQGRDVLIMERAYVADRYQWVSLAWNGLNNRGRFPVVDDGGARWERHFAHIMQPWRQTSGYCLLTGQVPTDASVMGVDIKRWYADTIEALRRLTDIPIRFRPHPNAREHYCPKGVEPITGSLEDALSAAAFVVTFNSNTGVDAVMAGVPVYAMDQGSMAWDVAAHSLSEDVWRPDRTGWAHRMAYTQWLPEEIADGTAWEHLRGLL